MSDPVAARIKKLWIEDDEYGTRAEFRFQFTDPEAERRWWALLEKATGQGYAIEVRLIHYEGHPDMIEQAKARKARKTNANQERTLSPELGGDRRPGPRAERQLLRGQSSLPELSG